MDKLLRIVEQLSLSQTNIDAERLKFSNTNLKIWEYANVSFEDYQKLSFDNRSAILRNYYSEMCNRYPGSGIFFLFYFVTAPFFFCLVCCSFCSNFLFLLFLDSRNLDILHKNTFKSANLVSMTKSAIENDRNLTKKIVAASFENDIGSADVLGEKVWRSFGFFEVRKCGCNMKKVNFSENTLFYLNQAYLTVKKGRRFTIPISIFWGRLLRLRTLLRTWPLTH